VHGSGAGPHRCSSPTVRNAREQLAHCAVWLSKRSSSSRRVSGGAAAAAASAPGGHGSGAPVNQRRAAATAVSMDVGR